MRLCGSGSPPEHRAEAAFLQSILASLPASVLCVDEACRVRYRGGVLFERLGLADIAVGDHLPERPGVAEAVRGAVLRAIAGEDVLVSVATHDIAVELRFSPTYEDDGTINGASGVMLDLSERRDMEELIAYHATHDALTGLPNKSLHLDRLERALLISGTTAAPLTMVALDVVDYAGLVSSIGPLDAQLALADLAARLHAATDPSNASLARIVNDRFVWILPGTSEAEAVRFAQRLRTVTDDPVNVRGRRIGLVVIAAVIPLNGPEITVAEAARRGAVAMSHAQRGRVPVAVYDLAMEAEGDDPTIVAELRDALRNDEFTLHYQPIFSVATGAIEAAEALIRWRHPSRGFLHPDAFVQMAERAGLIGPVSDWVLNHAFADLAKWQRLGYVCDLAVNLSAWDLVDSAFPNRYARFISDHNVDPRSVQLELTETAFAAEYRRTADVLGEIRTIGSTIALDDFGTGYSSLAHLRELPVHSIKIDRSFVGTMDGDDGSRAIVRAIAALGIDLGMRVVAEGVETQSAYDAIASYGCTAFQGYLRGQPSDLNHFLSRLSESQMR